MYSNSHPDRFAGQYPPPPPLQSTVTGQPSYPPQQDIYPPPQQDIYPPPQSTYYNDYPQQQHEVYSIPQDAYSPPPTRTEFYNQPQPQYNSHMAAAVTPPMDEERHISGVNDYHNHNHHDQSSLDDYLRQEREEYLKHENSDTTVKQNQVTPLYNTSKPEEDEKEPEKIPMVQKEQPLSRKERKRIEKLKQQHYQSQQPQPYLTKPTLAPENEAETYRPKPYEEKRSSGCNCCCYNPAITCCSFFCLLISISFCAAGVAMMIASKVVTDKCNNECFNMIDQAQSACGTICSKVLHDGMLYGGAVVAGLAGIAIVWKIIMWTCAGYSKR